MGKSLVIVLLILVQWVKAVDALKAEPHQHLEMNQTLRVDFILSGYRSEQEASLFRLSRDQGWNGSVNQLISPFDYGEYRYFLIHPDSGDTLFSKGFSSLFEEWRTTHEATYKIRAFQQTVVMPFPKQTSILVIEGRNRNGTFIKLLQETIDPVSIAFNKPVKSNHLINIIQGDDFPAKRADLLFISEGYNINELDNFIADVKKLTVHLFSVEPFKSLKKQFTIRTLSIPSPESGVTDPLTGNWKDTFLKSRFNTFDTDRYLQTMETWKVYETAALAPYDHIIILVNTRKYGGGGIYNHFSILTSGSRLSGDLLIHELGHGLAGLGDEYADGEISYSDYINLKTEPWQPNLTTLVDFGKKWHDLIDPSTPIPTPIRPMFENSTGVFEGGGYASKGVYRPAMFCRMRSANAENFCEVCHHTITVVTNFFTQ